jgi:hypothetical protein
MQIGFAQQNLICKWKHCWHPGLSEWHYVNLSILYFFAQLQIKFLKVILLKKDSK